MQIQDTIYLSSNYLAPIEYYQKLVQYPNIVIEQHDHYIKQTYRNRCNIVGPEGEQSLIVPIIKPNADKQCMKDIRISDHGNWQHQHWQAIKSAYKNSPFYDYYEDDFITLYSHNQESLFEFNQKLQDIVCSLLDITPNISYTTEFKTSFKENELDFRDVIHPKKDYTIEDPEFISKQYYQVFEQRHQFIPNLSILDLLFNMGPESIYFLDKSYL